MHSKWGWSTPLVYELYTAVLINAKGVVNVEKEHSDWFLGWSE